MSLSDSAPALLGASGLWFAYPGAREPVLRGVDLAITEQASIALHGANGSGKTTLLRCLTGLEKIDSGAIFLEGLAIKTNKDFQRLRRAVGYSLQNAEDQLFFPSVMEDISFGPLNLGLEPGAAQRRAREALASLGLEGFERRITYELSGGQQKLVALAAVLAMRPRILLLDEPLNGLDERAAGRVEEALLEYAGAKLVISHSQEFLERICGEHLIMENGALRAI